MTEPVGDALAPGLQPTVPSAPDTADPATPNPAAEPAVRPARQAKTLPPQQETAAGAPGAARLTATARSDSRLVPAAETAGPAAAKLRHHKHPALHATASPPPAHAPGNVPAPRSPAPEDAACGTAPTVPPAFLTPGHGPRATHAFTPSHGVFVPLWRACEPGTGPG
ncbi:hypothetical protein ABZ342_23525 [Amycolatopsis sp. NPDC005961]|uniref:hypothetical protein n=1 Tax=Amycolatopsis sp. NPDC005961 TaxID=3156720 RepID=UPI0034094F42